jgi:hypothetical protein
MSFQSNVQILQGAGVPGEQYSDSPWVAQSYTINSTSAANNIIGSTVCSISSQGFCQAGNVGAAYVIAGLLVDPKNVALFGTGGIPLSPTLTVPNFTQVECATEGSFWVHLGAAANIGDWLIYDETTGLLASVAPGTSLPSNKQWANGTVSYSTVSGAGLAVVTLNPGVGQPTNV